MTPFRSRFPGFLRPDWLIASVLVALSVLALPTGTAHAAGPSDRDEIN